MYDAVFVLVEAFNKILRKKPDQFRSNIQRRGQPGVIGFNSTTTSNGSNGGSTRTLDCNTSKGWVNPWEHGDKISRYLRKVILSKINNNKYYFIVKFQFRFCFFLLGGNRRFNW